MKSSDCSIKNCEVCSQDLEPCRQCNNHDVVFDDYGVTLCASCLKNSTIEQKNWLDDQFNKELDR